MAKSNKKSSAKAAKKPTAKTKPKAKKVAAKAKAKVVKKAPAKKVAKKIVAKKAAKKIAPVKKVAPKKEAKIKVPKAPKEPKAPKAPKEPKALTRRQEAMAIPKNSPQLTIFPIITQRPIAHKQVNPSITPDDKTRYSENELKEFEVLIKSKLEKARDEFKILKDTLNRNNDAGTDSTSGGNTKVLEDGAETAEKENLSQLAARQLKYMTNLENALVRIKNGTYGICTVTGKLISKERLIAVPHTTQSIEAKMMKQD
jgi:RNA polymerase-binding transcription factor DksA